MNITIFWVLFLTIIAFVPIMIIKGKPDESETPKDTKNLPTKKKGWF